MAVRKDEKRGKWLAETYINGKRNRKWFDTKGEAQRYYNAMKQENSPLFKAVQIHKEQPQRLSELVNLWYDLHGKSLVSGKARYQKLLFIAKNVGDPIATHFTSSHFADYRAKRLNGEIINETTGIIPKENYINSEQAMLHAMFGELIRLNKWKGKNPISGVRKFKVKETNLSFLRAEEIDRLLVACDQSRNPHLPIIVRICLATGARWGEAQALTGAQIIPHKITYAQTKGGRNRTVPITKELYDMLPLKSGAIFTGVNYRQSLRVFNYALKRAKIDLPKGQATHVLRHTFASHFMMNGGNILVLRDILGHTDITMTMRYAHFAPSHLEAATTLNPLAKRQT
ncbi:integrase [Pasteurellaceae bacterium Macca]|nr:integrase [Pasteurellaceae bacterium Macca]